MAARASLKLPSATAYYAKGSVLTATSEHITEPGNLTIDFGTEPPTVHAERPGYWLPVLKFFDLAQDLPPAAARRESRRTILYVGGLLIVAAAVLLGWKLKPTLFPSSAATEFAEQIVKESMTDPDSFVRRSSELVWQEKTASGGNAYAVKVDYSGTNALGGRIRNCQTVLFMVEGDKLKWLPGDQNLPCESGDLLKRGDAKAIEVLTSGIREYLVMQSPRTATPTSVETQAPVAVTPLTKRPPSSDVQSERMPPLGDIEGVWNCGAEGEVQVSDANGAVIFTLGESGVGPFTIEFSADGLVREHASDYANLVGTWTPGDHASTIHGSRRTLLRDTEHPDRLYVRNESSTRREAEGLAGRAHECRRSRKPKAEKVPVTATTTSPAPKAEEPVAAPSAAPVVVRPSLQGPGARISDPEYPPASRRKGETGQVVLRIEVLPSGRPGTVEIESSTGFPDLDAAAVEEVQRNWRLVPGTTDGVPNTQWLTVNLGFGLTSD